LQDLHARTIDFNKVLVRRVKRRFDSGKSTPDAMVTRIPIPIARMSDKRLGWKTSTALSGMAVKMIPNKILSIAIH
jgi:hypothetical protein